MPPERLADLYLACPRPGLLAASAGNDAGGIATYASAGASYGYGLLWAMVLVTLCVGVVQEMSARMGAVTGKGFSDLVRENFSLRTTALILLTLLVANAGIIVSEFIGIAAAAELFGVSRYIAVPIAAVLRLAAGDPRLLRPGGEDLPCPHPGLPGLHRRRLPGQAGLGRGAAARPCAPSPRSTPATSTC